MVKLLYHFLGQDVSNIILDYLYRPDKRLLNMEYNSKFIYRTDYHSKKEYLYCCPTGIEINDVYPIYNRCEIVSFLDMDTYISDIPLRYSYSSGLNSIYGYMQEIE